MLTSKSLWEYRRQFNTNKCFFAEPGNQIMILDEETDNYHISPFDETDEIFMDRLERCKKEQQNLFFKEWETFSYKEGCLY